MLVSNVISIIIEKNLVEIKRIKLSTLDSRCIEIQITAWPLFIHFYRHKSMFYTFPFRCCATTMLPIVFFVAFTHIKYTGNQHTHTHTQVCIIFRWMHSLLLLVCFVFLLRSDLCEKSQHNYNIHLRTQMIIIIMSF